MPDDRRPAHKVSLTASSLIALFVFSILTITWTWPLILDPGTYLSGLNDPPLFTWILTTVSKSIYTDPLNVFQGDIFYPYGRTITFSEPLIFPALVTGAPVYALSGNPILAYNVTLLVFQTLSAWAAWYAVRRISHTNAGAYVAGIVFAYSSFKLGYYNFLNIHLSFAVPLAIVFFIAFCQQSRWRDLAFTVFFVFIQAASIWYAAIPLGFMLCVLFLLYLILRPGPWWTGLVARSAVGAIVLILLLLPIVLPYFQTHTEMVFVRSLDEINKFRGDVLSFLDPGVVNAWHRLFDSGREPGIFAGFTVMAFALFATVGAMISIVRRNESRAIQIVTAIILITICTSAGLLAWSFSATYLNATTATIGTALDPKTVHKLIQLIFVLYVVLLLIVGVHSLRTQKTQSVRQDEWILIFSILTFISMLMVLGPEIHVGGVSVGKGIYATLYDYVPGFNGLRIAIRLAFMYLFFVGLLAAFAIRFIESKGKGSIKTLVWLAPLIAAVELWPKGIEYQKFDWQKPPPVYAQIKEREGQGAVLSLPTFNENYDSLYMLWALKHGKPIVNGVSGFYPPDIQHLATLASALPSRRDASRLKRIDGLKYLVIHLDTLNNEKLVEDWLALADSPPAGMMYSGRFESALLFEMADEELPAWRWRRDFASRYWNLHDEIRFDISLPDMEATSLEHQVLVSINGEKDSTHTVAPGERTALNIQIAKSSFRVRPVAVQLNQTYRLAVDTHQYEQYAIGSSDTHAPVDIVVESAAQSHGAYVAVWVNGINHAVRQPGYNVVVLDPDTGQLLASSAFDVAKLPERNVTLAKFIENAPAKSIVILSLKNRGINNLDDTSLKALELIGAGTLSLREYPDTASHLVIGVKGAAPGSAVELADDRQITHIVGKDRRSLAMKIENFVFHTRGLR